MWIKTLFLLFILNLVACQPPVCTDDERLVLKSDVKEAYDSWKYHLNYLDRSVVFSDSEFLKCSLRDLHTCAEIDTSIIARIDSAIWYFTHVPVTTQHMEQGGMLVHEVEAFMEELFREQ